MASSTTKPIAARIPIELYNQVKNKAEERGCNMNDYLIRIIAKHIESTSEKKKSKLKELLPHLRKMADSLEKERKVNE